MREKVDTIYFVFSQIDKTCITSYLMEKIQLSVPPQDLCPNTCLYFCPRQLLILQLTP